MIYTRESVMALVREKEKLEETLKELWDVLQSNNVGMQEPLVDREGFPRSDIDVYQVRHARHQIKCLQNDHTSLMQKIEAGLAVVMSASAASPSLDPNGTNAPPPPHPQEPFARVDHITPASPAHLAGLQEGDQLTKFGSITADNFRDLPSLGQLVQHSVNQALQVRVVRAGEPVSLTLTPRQWSGRGLLGCNIVPVEKLDR